jgi:response regulator RpfG family c-di-GMP phosphodiesterase
MEVITSQAGLQFDPRVVDAFVGLDVENLAAPAISQGATPPAA